jgi:thioredoxin 1
MTMTRDYAETETTREAVDAMNGPTLLEFGAPWCGHCIAAQPLLERTLGLHPELRHMKIEDGRGRPLGRSYRVKLWPTLIFLRDGEEIERLVRPADPDAIAEALQRIDPR